MHCIIIRYRYRSAKHICKLQHSAFACASLSDIVIGAQNKKKKKSASFDTATLRMHCHRILLSELRNHLLAPIRRLCVSPPWYIVIGAQKPSASSGTAPLHMHVSSQGSYYLSEQENSSASSYTAPLRMHRIVIGYLYRSANGHLLASILRPCSGIVSSRVLLLKSFSGSFRRLR